MLVNPLPNFLVSTKPVDIEVPCFELVFQMYFYFLQVFQCLYGLYSQFYLVNVLFAFIFCCHFFLFLSIKKSHTNYVCRLRCVLESAANAVIGQAMEHAQLMVDNSLVCLIRLRCHLDSVAMIVVDAGVMLDLNCTLFLPEAIVL